MFEGRAMKRSWCQFSDSVITPSMRRGADLVARQHRS
jgi:hypothetical protein